MYQSFLALNELKVLRVGVEMELSDLLKAMHVAELTYKAHCLKKRATAMRE